IVAIAKDLKLAVAGHKLVNDRLANTTDIKDHLAILENNGNADDAAVRAGEDRAVGKKDILCVELSVPFHHANGMSTKRRLPAFLAACRYRHLRQSAAARIGVS